MTTHITKIIALDDDPTGSQTVHSCLLLTQWDVTTLVEALLDETGSPLFFVLTNTRGMDATKAADITRGVCHNLKIALNEIAATRNIQITPIMVSRSDSTLRGHYPIETNVIASELGPFAAHFIIPAFFEGGRVTIDSTHYIKSSSNDGDSKLIPVHETEFAKDSVFGFTTSYLPDYVEEKTKGAIKSNQVERFLLDDVRGRGDRDCLDRIRNLRNNVCCVVDCETQDDLDSFANRLKQVASETGTKYLFRSGASLLTALAQLPPQPVSALDMATYVRGGAGTPGAVIAGSHVQKTTDQLKHLLRLDQVKGIEVDVTKISNKDEATKMMSSILQQLTTYHNQGKHVVIYSSRSELRFPDEKIRLEFGSNVSSYLMDIVRSLPITIGFLISKGGITSNDVLSDGLQLRTCRVLGQILPGCSVVKCPNDHSRYPNLPVVIFPGNVGDETSLSTALQRLSGNEQTQAQSN